MISVFQVVFCHKRQPPGPEEGHQGSGGDVERAGGARRKPVDGQSAEHVGQEVLPVPETAGQLRCRLLRETVIPTGKCHFHYPQHKIF